MRPSICAGVMAASQPGTSTGLAIALASTGRGLVGAVHTVATDTSTEPTVGAGAGAGAVTAARRAASIRPT